MPSNKPITLLQAIALARPGSLAIVGNEGRGFTANAFEGDPPTLA